MAGEPALRGMPDEDLLVYVTSLGRALVTEKVVDFMPLAMRWTGTSTAHAGLIVTNPKAIQPGNPHLPGNLTRGLRHFLADPPISGESWIWWL